MHFNLRKQSNQSPATQLKSGAKVIRFSPEAGREEALISSVPASKETGNPNWIPNAAFRLRRFGANAELSLQWAEAAESGRPSVIRVA